MSVAKEYRGKIVTLEKSCGPKPQGQFSARTGTMQTICLELGYDLPDNAAIFHTAMRRGAIQLAGRIERHVRVRVFTVGAASEIVERAVGEAAARAGELKDVSTVQRAAAVSGSIQISGAIHGQAGVGTAVGCAGEALDYVEVVAAAVRRQLEDGTGAPRPAARGRAL